MADGDNPQTPPNDPAGTGGDNTPAAPQEPNGQGGAPDEMVSVPKSKLDGLEKSNKDLLSQRDKNANELAGKDEFLLTIAKEREIDGFISSNKDKFPDVTRDDLMLASSMEEVEQLAGQQQKRFDEVVQKKLRDVQSTTAPILSPEERSQKLKKLKEGNAPDRFEQMADLRMQPNAT